jgi:hypothetical protein
MFACNLHVMMHQGQLFLTEHPRLRWWFWHIPGTCSKPWHKFSKSLECQTVAADGYKGGHNKGVVVTYLPQAFSPLCPLSNPTLIMLSPVLHADAAAGITTITAITALRNARPLPGTKTVVLDAQIYVGSPFCKSLMGSLRFFNVSDMVFKHESALYLIYATVCALFQSPEYFEYSILTPPCSVWKSGPVRFFASQGWWTETWTGLSMSQDLKKPDWTAKNRKKPEKTGLDRSWTFLV